MQNIIYIDYISIFYIMALLWIRKCDNSLFIDLSAVAFTQRQATYSRNWMFAVLS